MYENIAANGSAAARPKPMNRRSVSSSRNVPRSSARPPVRRRSTGTVSRGRSSNARNSTAPIAASTRNTPRQVVTSSSCPPMMGARIGATPLTSMVSAKKRADALPVCRSRTTAGAMTMPAAPASPWAARKAMSWAASAAAAQAREASV